jgi:hypothetical protein
MGPTGVVMLGEEPTFAALILGSVVVRPERTRSAEQADPQRTPG